MKIIMTIINDNYHKIYINVQNSFILMKFYNFLFSEIVLVF